MSTTWIQHVRHTVWAAALAVAVMGAAGHAWAQQAQADDDDIEDHILNADKRLLNSILQPLGLGSPEGPSIDYRERSPLVVPKGRDLPPPGKAVRSGDWPIEPETKAKREKAALRKAGKDPDALIRYGRNDEKPISGTPEQYKTASSGTWSADPAKGQQEPGFFSMMFKGQLQGSWNETSKFDGEPPRTSLIDPPPGYLTPSPVAPYGVTPRADAPQKKEPKL